VVHTSRRIHGSRRGGLRRYRRLDEKSIAFKVVM
jgi:hypothetical protein